MALLGKLVIELAANTARLQSDMGKAVGIVERGATQIKGAFKFLSGGIAGGLLGSAIADAGAKAIKLGDDLNKAAIKAGVGGKVISELAYAARMADVDLSGLSTALKKMQVSLSQAASGGKEQNRALQALGLTIADLQGLRADQQFEMLADQIARMPDAADRARAATEIFGKAGADLLPLFEKGAAGIRMAREEAQRLGFSFSDEQLKRLADADDATKRLTASWEAFAATLTSKVGPQLTRVLDAASSGRLTPDWKTAFKSPFVLAYNEWDMLYGDQGKGKPVAGRRGGDPSSSSMRSPLGFAAQNAAEVAAAASKKAADAALKEGERLDDQWRAMNVDLNRDMGALADKSLQDDIAREAKRLDMVDEFYERQKQEAKDLAEFRAEQDAKLSDSAQIWKDTFLQAFDDMINTGKIKWDELAKYMAARFAQRGIDKFFDAAFSGGGKSGGGFNWGSLISSLFGGFKGSNNTSAISWVDDFKANGGPVSAGKSYLVGERGMELFRPNTSGTIVPNSKIGGATNFAPTYNIQTNDPDALPRLMRENNRRFFDELERRGYLKT